MLKHLDKENVLIVDDDAISLMLLESLLTDLGYGIHAFTSGEQALKAVKTLMPDLIILDIHMPGLDGYQICQKLKEDEETIDIPIIFASSLSEETDKVKGFELGAVDYVTKPISAEELKYRVSLHLELSFQRSLSSQFSASSDNYHDHYYKDKQRILELKQEVNELALELGRKPPYMDVY